MGARLTTIVTKTGDDGTTGLGDGTRVGKDHPRVVACGAVDELNSALGVVLAEPLPERARSILQIIQHVLFDVGGDLSLPGERDSGERPTHMLEEEIAAMNGQLPVLKEFILPGGTPAAAACHLARAICRRAERDIVTLSRAEMVASTDLVFMNRLSDFLFLLARTLNKEAGIADTMWDNKKQGH